MQIRLELHKEFVHKCRMVLEVRESFQDGPSTPNIWMGTKNWLRWFVKAKVTSSRVSLQGMFTGKISKAIFSKLRAVPRQYRH